MMGKLVKGKWTEGSIITSDDKGSYKREERSFRDFIFTDSPLYPPEADRYHLYVSYACPWAHRTLIYLHLKELTDLISVSVVHPDMLDKGWSFDQRFAGTTGDHLYHLNYLYQIYQKADDQVSSSVSVPVLWDKKRKTIVNNESSEIIRMFNSEFDILTGNKVDLYPKELRADIDRWNDKIYESVNNGVYRAGFAQTQSAYNQAVDSLFAVLEELNKHLQGRHYLLGDLLTEADIRLIPTLLRFDLVYYSHFKCNINMISDYKYLQEYLIRLYRMDAVKRTTDFDHIKRHYYYSHEGINPKRIVPKGPSFWVKQEFKKSASGGQ